MHKSFTEIQDKYIPSKHHLNQRTPHLAAAVLDFLGPNLPLL